MEFKERMKHYTDDELIEGLRGRETRCIDYLYREYFPVVRHHVQHNSGTVTDAEDLFQDALVALYHWSTSAAYHLNCSLKTYFMGIVKNLWRQRLDTKYRLCYSANLEVHEDRAGYSTFNDTVDADELEKERIFFKHLMNMPDDCRRLLQLFCLKVSLKEIARLLRYSDDEYVKTRKYLCKRMLRKRIMKDPEGKQYVSYERP